MSCDAGLAPNPVVSRTLGLPSLDSSQSMTVAQAFLAQLHFIVHARGSGVPRPAPFLLEGMLWSVSQRSPSDIDANYLAVIQRLSFVHAF